MGLKPLKLLTTVRWNFENRTKTCNNVFASKRFLPLGPETQRIAVDAIKENTTYSKFTTRSFKGSKFIGADNSDKNSMKSNKFRLSRLVGIIGFLLPNGN